MEWKNKKIDVQTNMNSKEKFKKMIVSVSPFILSTFLTSSAMCFLTGSKPFIIDEIKSIKTYELEYNGYDAKQVDEKYIAPSFVDKLYKSSLTIYTPFNYQDGEYVRYKKVYSINGKMAVDVYKALVSKDYEFILDNVDEKSLEVQKTNFLGDNYVNDYYAEAKIYAADFSNYYNQKESVKSNTLITLIDIFSGIWLGLIFTRKSKKLIANDSANERVLSLKNGGRNI